LSATRYGGLCLRKLDCVASRTEDNHHVMIAKETYIVSGDGFLMPVRKGQPAPDLKFFDQASK
jgi:hypothetical protein